MKINKTMIFRLICALIFWTIFFFPALFVPRRFQYKLLFPIFTKLFLFATKIRPHYCSEINLNQYSSVIYASNHKNFVDTYIVTNFLRKPFSIVLKKEMTRNPLFKFMAWKMGLIPIDRNEAISQKNAICKIKKMASKNYSIIMFPEGWYHFDKPVGKLKRGIAKIAKETDVKVVPLAIYGILNDFIYEKKLVWKDAYLKSGKPMKYSDYDNEKLFLDALKSKIEKLYLELEHEVKE
ncbi:MAG: 1-acyl-sn-glycerol-3-phosphate acyltransferase [Spirochaetes bacterium]|nr:1-acyl-sn-glycerol-3-phosphate acyltransferase [Spirochaetota bacterium]